MEQNNGQALVPVNTRTGEIMEAQQYPELTSTANLMLPARYVGISAEPFSDAAREILARPTQDEDIEIRPDGLIYVAGIKYRRLLNEAFGPGSWAILPISIDIDKGTNMMYYKGALFVLGRFVSEAIGEQQYFPDNDRMSYATAAESAKSNCLMRCAKDLGAFSACWDPAFVRAWLDKHAVEVWCVNIGKGNGAGGKKKLWRRKTSPPIEMFPWKEEGGGRETLSDRKGDQYMEKQRQQAPAQPAKAAAPATQPATGQTADTAHTPAEVERSFTDDPTGTGTVYTGPGTPAAPEKRSSTGPTISPKQKGRLVAIANSNGWKPLEVTILLQRMGYDIPEELPRKPEYDDVCDVYLPNPETLADVRAEITRRTAAGEVLKALV